MNLSRITPANEIPEPVDIDYVKTFARVDDDAPGNIAVLDRLIPVARAFIEKQTSRLLITQKWTMRFNAWDRCNMSFPRAPIQSIESIKYLDQAGNEQTWASQSYRLIGANDVLGRARWETSYYDVTFPSLRGVSDQIAVVFTAGYGNNPEDVPPELRHAIALLVSYWYEVREPVNIGNISSMLPYTVEELIRPYRLMAV